MWTHLWCAVVCGQTWADAMFDFVRCLPSADDCTSPVPCVPRQLVFLPPHFTEHADLSAWHLNRRLVQKSIGVYRVTTCPRHLKVKSHDDVGLHGRERALSLKGKDFDARLSFVKPWKCQGSRLFTLTATDVWWFVLFHGDIHIFFSLHHHNFSVTCLVLEYSTVFKKWQPKYLPLTGQVPYSQESSFVYAYCRAVLLKVPDSDPKFDPLPT